MRVLMTTGGSVHSELALHYGAQLAAANGVEVTILSVVRREADRPEAERVLARAKEIVGAKAAHVNLKTRRGQTAAEILQEAGEGKFDLLVLGERGLHSLAARMLGTVSERIARESPCPVLIVKGNLAPISRILICDSGAVSPSLLTRIVNGPLQRLVHLASDVVVLHVMSQISAGLKVDDAIAQAEAAQLQADADTLIRQHSYEGIFLKEDVGLLSARGIRTQPKVRHGLVVEEILAEAREGNFDLVVIGAHRDEGWQRFLLDDIAQEVLEGLDRPLLVMH